MTLPASFWLSVGVMLWIIVNMLVVTTLAYWKLDRMEKLLDKCSLVMDSKAGWGEGLMGRTRRVSMVAAALSRPLLHPRCSVIDLEQVHQFPKGLKRVVVGIHISILLSCLAIVVVHFSIGSE
ncbi:hypothetical protein [Pseudomonas sp. MWU13-2100]|uniref:hypothetical protein n=1 Tax=Pseudomonas sp. MWU13-2100 TaxID=2935075 RepID=UPI00200E5921|nr:hypothetical protein [Pseudomonas sp. MWU13-2100]